MKMLAKKIDRNCDREVKLPYKCFCCCDSGLAAGQWLTDLIEGDSDIPFICKRMDCEAGRSFDNAWNKSHEERRQNGNCSAITYQNSFDVRLHPSQCEDAHNFVKQEFISMIANQRRENIYAKFVEAASDRTDTINSIRSEMKVQNLTESAFEAALVHCIKRDGVLYLHWESLPTATLKVLLGKMQVN